MLDSVYHLPVLWMAVVIFTIVYLITWGIYAIVMAFARRGAKRVFTSVSTGMLSPLGTVFGLLVAFLAVQVWGDSRQANDAVDREASALRSVVLLSAGFPQPTQEQVRSLVRRQIQESATHEWDAMAHRTAALTTIPRPLAEALQLVLDQVPQSKGQTIAQRETVRALEEALDARRQRIILSHSTINWIKWSGLAVEGLLTLLTIGMVHSDNRPAAFLAMVIFATAAAAAAVLIASHARPFTGEISERPDVLLQVLPEAGS